MSQTAYSRPYPIIGLPKMIESVVGGAVGLSIIYPIDLIKTRLQNQQVLADGTRMYKNILDTGAKTAQADGFRGLYRGLGVNALFMIPHRVVKLTVIDFLLRNKYNKENGRISRSYFMMAWVSAVLCQTVVTTPMELLKIQQQDQTRSGTQKVSSLQIVQRHGIATIYRGLLPTVIRDISFTVLYFPLIAIMLVTEYFSPDVKDPSQPKKRIDALSAVKSSVIAASIASLAVNPFDVVKTRLQTINKAPGEMTYSSMGDCFWKIYRHEGIQAFYKGGFCRIIMIAPLCGILHAVKTSGLGNRVCSSFE